MKAWGKSLHMAPFLDMVLPAFKWLTFGIFCMGLIESFLCGEYAGLVFRPHLHFRNYPTYGCWGKRMAVLIDPEKSSVLRVASRLMQILRVLARHRFLRALLGKRYWPPPKVVRETL